MKGRGRAPVPRNFTQRGGEPLKELLKRLWREEEGQDLTEYALLLVLIALVAAVAVAKYGSVLNSIFEHIL